VDWDLLMAEAARSRQRVAQIDVGWMIQTKNRNLFRNNFPIYRLRWYADFLLLPQRLLPFFALGGCSSFIFDHHIFHATFRNILWPFSKLASDSADGHRGRHG
jgi:hypothetical protein